jgi:hypothetical protein
MLENTPWPPAGTAAHAMIMRSYIYKVAANQLPRCRELSRDYAAASRIQFCSYACADVVCRIQFVGNEHMVIQKGPV